jgi:hypothetical protein
VARRDPPRETLASIRPAAPPRRPPRRPVRGRVVEATAKLLMAAGFVWAIVAGWGDLPLPVSIVFLVASVATVGFAVRDIRARRRARGRGRSRPGV